MKWFKGMFKTSRISRKRIDAIEAKVREEYSETIAYLDAKIKQLEGLPKAVSTEVVRYVPIQVFDTKQREYVGALANIAESKEFLFYLTDAREKFFAALKNARGADRLIMQGHIQAVDLVMRELLWYSNQYAEMGKANV